MSKFKKTYVCQSCGANSPKWIGKCEGCGSWNTLIEDFEPLIKQGVQLIEWHDLEGPIEVFSRKISGIQEFDRVCGGGLVPGSVILVGGDPGIGKSTILLQALANLSKSCNCIYISGEESVDQIRLRARRLGVEKSQLNLATATNLASVLKAFETKKTDVVVIDSIQTLQDDSLDSVIGTISQVRACASALINWAKKTGSVVLLIGHVTKEGIIAGPKVLEHMVDTVLYFEGERGHPFRILRAVKNRYGACDEIGVFEMSGKGLNEVSNPSALFLSHREADVPGTVVFAGIEGTRPILVEIQALVGSSGFSNPRRAVVGWDLNRLFMILAVLESRCKFSFSNRDVYLNVAGGIKLTETAADLAVAMALVSALSNEIIPKETVVFGEVGLTGEIRPVLNGNSRLKESQKLGFKSALAPWNQKEELLPIISVRTLNQALQSIDLDNPERRKVSGEYSHSFMS